METGSRKKEREIKEQETKSETETNAEVILSIGPQR